MTGATAPLWPHESAPLPRDPQPGDPVGVLSIDGTAVPWKYHSADPRGYTTFSQAFPGRIGLLSLFGLPSASYGVSWRFAEECTFLRSCPMCRARGRMRPRRPEAGPDGLAYGEINCPTCDGRKEIPWEPFAPGAEPPSFPEVADADGIIWATFGGHRVALMQVER